MDRGEAALLALILLLLPVLAVGQWSASPGAGGQDAPEQGVRSGGAASIAVLAVDGYGRGVVGEASVTVTKGAGRVLVDLGGSLPDAAAQASAATAAKAASAAAGTSLNDADVIYSFRLPADAAAGPSAGAALAAATAAALQGKSIANGTAITGAILEDGTITAVTGLRQKALAAKEADFALLLVPRRGGPDAGAFARNQSCGPLAGRELCSTDYLIDTETLSKEMGIRVQAVGSLAEAMQYLTEGTHAT